jgi:hypothetical protein
MWLAQAFQPRLANAFGKPKEPRLHVRRENGNFSGDSIVQDFNSPRHTRLYLNFEIDERGRRARSVSIKSQPWVTRIDELDPSKSVRYPATHGLEPLRGARRPVNRINASDYCVNPVRARETIGR